MKLARIFYKTSLCKKNKHLNMLKPFKGLKILVKIILFPIPVVLPRANELNTAMRDPHFFLYEHTILH